MTILTTKAYIVLSVKEINALAKAARASQKSRQSSTRHCVLLDNLTVRFFKPGDEEAQISSTDFTAAVRRIKP